MEAVDEKGDLIAFFDDDFLFFCAIQKKVVTLLKFLGFKDEDNTWDLSHSMFVNENGRDNGFCNQFTSCLEEPFTKDEIELVLKKVGFREDGILFKLRDELYEKKITSETKFLD
ncbi:MAG: hypothetical protein J5588_03120 [Bacteroidales bacterium]|nr:hypothetical protein [Bacteroidales bacterium]